MNRKIDKIVDDRRDRHYKPREIDLSQKRSVVYKGICSTGEARRKITPSDISAHIEKELRSAVGGKSGNTSEDNGKHHGCQKRIDKRP